MRPWRRSANGPGGNGRSRLDSRLAERHPEPECHVSTAIEGNPLTLEQVRTLEEGRTPVASGERSRREILNYFAGLRHVETQAGLETIRHEDIFELHRILAGGVMV